MGKDFIQNLSYEDFVKINTPYELHNLADKCSFDTQKWIIESKLCSRATALMLFWNNHPEDFLGYSWKAKTGSRIDDFNLIRTIINNFERDFYLKTDISYDPSDVISKINFIPDVVLQICHGEEPYVYIDRKEVHSWFGDYLESKIHRCDNTMELYNIVVFLKHREMSVYEKILDHPFCDKAIAIMIYWLLDKYSNFTIYADDWLEIRPMLDKIVRKLENNEYPEILAYDPNKEVKPIKWKIPDYMFKEIR